MFAAFDEGGVGWFQIHHDFRTFLKKDAMSTD